MSDPQSVNSLFWMINDADDDSSNSKSVNE